MPDIEFSLDPQPVPTVETENRSIHTAIPAPGTREILERLAAVESRSMHGQLPLVWDRAEGHNVYDAAGNRWIDMTSTIFVANVGHSNQRVAQALRDAIDRPLQSCYAYGNEVRARYLERLTAFAGFPFEKAFLLSAGTEATEAVFKLMRMHGQSVGRRRLGVVCVEGNWHGRTLGAQMMSGNQGQKAWVGYQDADIHHIPFPYPWEVAEGQGAAFLVRSLEALAERGLDPAKDLCGVMLETFQGWGAVFYPEDWVQAISEECQRHGLLLAFDEMQSGFGRTGRRFGYEHYGVTPDLLACGKGMGGGVPLSGVLGRAEVMDLPGVGNMSSTHSANPLVCSAGLAVLDELDGRDLIRESERRGALMHRALDDMMQAHPGRIDSILGRGMIAAILVRDPETGAPDSAFASRVSERAMQKGVLVVHTGRESIKLGPPLTISDEALIEAVAVIEECVQECEVE